MTAEDERLLAESEKLRSEASALLEGGVMKIIESFAPAYVHGSFALDLMLRRDLDVDMALQHDHDSRTFFQVGAALTEKFRVFKASYSNHFIRGFPGFDHGLYWAIGLVIRDNAGSWTYGVWNRKSSLSIRRDFYAFKRHSNVSIKLPYSG